MARHRVKLSNKAPGALDVSGVGILEPKAEGKVIDIADEDVESFKNNPYLSIEKVSDDTPLSREPAVAPDMEALKAEQDAAFVESSTVDAPVEGGVNE